MCITLAGRYVQIPQTYNNIHDAWPYQQFAWYTCEEQRKGIESRKEWACSNSVDLVHCFRSKIQKWPDSHRFQILHKHFFLSLYVEIYMCFFPVDFMKKTVPLERTPYIGISFNSKRIGRNGWIVYYLKGV